MNLYTFNLEVGESREWGGGLAVVAANGAFESQRLIDKHEKSSSFAKDGIKWNKTFLLQNAINLPFPQVIDCLVYLE